MPTPEKVNKEIPIKPVDPANEKNAPGETVKKVVKAEKIEPVKVEGKSPMELEALKNGGAVDPVVVKTSKLEEKKEVDPVKENPIPEKENESENTVVEKLLENTKPEETAKVGSEVQEDIKQATAIIGTIAELSQNSEYKTKAKELMEAQNLNEIWHCSDSGYWFSRKDYVEEFERKNKCSLEYYKK